MLRFTLAGLRFVRSALALVALAGLTGCASRAAHPNAAVATPQFSNEEQKLLACLDLQDHIVDLYTREYVETQGISLSSTERVAFRDGWAEELAKRGTFERFEQSCFYSLTPNKYACGMHSRTTDGLTACMRLSMR